MRYRFVFICIYLFLVFPLILGNYKRKCKTFTYCNVRQTDKLNNAIIFSFSHSDTDIRNHCPCNHDRKTFYNEQVCNKTVTKTTNKSDTENVCNETINNGRFKEDVPI